MMANTLDAPFHGLASRLDPGKSNQSSRAPRETAAAPDQWRLE
jgi:hypothetical protein